MARDDLAKAYEAARKLDLARSVAVQTQKYAKGERDRLKAKLNQHKAQTKGFGPSLAKVRKEAVQEYSANFKETNDCLDLLNDATKEYKASLNRVNLGFDAEYYEKLILELKEP